MFKKLLLATCCVTSLSVQTKVYYPENFDLTAIDPTRIQVAWDIHNVPAQKEAGTWAKTAYVFKREPLAMAKAAFDVLWGKITKRENPAYLAYKDIQNLPKSADASGDAYASIFAGRGLIKIARVVHEVANMYKPRAGMLELIQEIHEKGILQRIASNIGLTSFVNLRAKFKNDFHNNLFEYIKEGKIVDYSNHGRATLPVTAPELASVGKPNPQFYKEFNATYNPDKTNLIVFIDDSLANVQAAIKEGWIGIHFDYKNPEAMTQLRNDLKSMGIL